MPNPSKIRESASIFGIMFGICFLLFFTSCTKTNRHIKGQKLAKVHCASCHLHSEPSILPRRIWGEQILPNMGLKMGMSHGPLYAYGDPDTLKNLVPTIPQEDWDNIVHYYLNKSENNIPEYPKPKHLSSELFKPHPFLIDSVFALSMTSFAEESGHLYLGNALNSELLRLDRNGKILSLEKLNSPPVKLVFKDSVNYILTIGNMNPSDEAKGKLMAGPNTIEGLTRPVDFLIRDIDLDGDDDIFICNYGNNRGDFSLFENLKNGLYQKHVIHPFSGAIKVEMKNMDDDEEDEIVVLFAQEHESIMIWDYDNLSFTGKKVVQFHPAFGSVDFQISDMNGDGLNDIVLANGDNADLSPVLKNFHGIRVLLNKGNKEFSEAYFSQMHGASKVRAEDFDLDGDVDMLAISNFGDFTNEAFKSVQLLINEGDMAFKSKIIKELPDFRWQTIDLSDYDKDGDMDIFLGAFKVDIGPEESSISDKDNISWVKLENTSK